MNDVAFLMRLVNTDTKLHISAGSYAVPMNDVAFSMRLVNTGIELRITIILFSQAWQMPP